MRINHNVAALNAWRNLSQTDSALNKSLERLSSGLRINRAADDAAGLAISEKMRAQIRGLQMAQRNAQDGISLVQTAEGALNEVHSILQRMRELAVQAANDTYTPEDRNKLQNEIDQLVEELNRIAEQTEFNTLKLFDPSTTAQPLVFHIGANATQNIQVQMQQVDAATLGVNNVDVTTQAGADAAITSIDDAIQTVSDFRSELGAVQNRLEHTIANLGVAVENLQAAESRIRDVDMALEMANFTRNQILLQSGIAMLAQANAMPQAVLQLLSA